MAALASHRDKGDAEGQSRSVPLSQPSASLPDGGTDGTSPFRGCLSVPMSGGTERQILDQPQGRPLARRAYNHRQPAKASIVLRVTAKEKAQIEKGALLSGMTVTAFVLSLALDWSVHVIEQENAGGAD